MSLVVFEVAGVRVAVAASDVLEVVAVRDPTPVPAAPPFLAGLFAHRGAVLPLVDGAERLAARAAGDGAASAALLLSTRVGPVALTIDRVIDVVRGVDDLPDMERLDIEALVQGCRRLVAPGEEGR